MLASWYGHLNVVRTLLDGGADANEKNNVRNQNDDDDDDDFIDDEDIDVCR